MPHSDCRIHKDPISRKGIEVIKATTTTIIINYYYHYHHHHNNIIIIKVMPLKACNKPVMGPYLPNFSPMSVFSTIGLINNSINLL